MCMNPSSEQEALDLERGLFLIRYKSAESEISPPTIIVSVDSASDGRVELILPPDATRTILQSPGACLVARATNNCRLWTAVEPTDPRASDVVSIELTELPNDQIADQESD